MPTTSSISFRPALLYPSVQCALPAERVLIRRILIKVIVRDYLNVISGLSSPSAHRYILYDKLSTYYNPPPMVGSI